MKTRLKVIKEDGSVEEYLHTKVLGTISNALTSVGRGDIYAAEQLAEVVTYYLYHGRERRQVTSSEILSIVKVVLTSTNYEDAAVAVEDHHLGRRLKRARIEVVPVDVRELTDAQALAQGSGFEPRSRWDKSRIVGDVVAEHGVSQQTARAIASMVEDKIFSMGVTRVPVSLLRQLVLGDTAVVMNAERELQAV